MSSYATRNEASVDTVVAVAGQYFVAHRDVLVEHSGYFRGVLLMPTGGLMVSPFQTVIVSSLVSPRTFAVLLDFMYSSRLRLDADVADVLRCAQLLDMPKVVELCREYILRAEYPHPLTSHQPQHQHQQQPMARGFPARLWPPPPMFAQSHQASLMSIPSTSTGTSSSIRVIRPIASRQPLPSQQQSYDFHLSCGAVAEQQQLQRPEEGRALDEQCQSHWTSSPEDRHQQQQQQRPESASSESWISVVDSDGHSTSKGKENEDDEAIVEDSPTSSSMSTSSMSQKLEQKQKEEQEDGELKKVAIVDVAYCDGPVKFQRILNENCDLVMVLQTTIVPCSKSKHRGKGIVVEKPDDEPSKKSKRGKGQVEAPEPKEHDVQGGGSSASTFCVHCKHTFKSRYCYMKHKRRHLNPLTVQDECVESSKDNREAEEAAPSVVGWPVESGGHQSSDEQNSKKLLEINSTFYPCKLCGSKFPSYYFLHKHQRIFHASASTSADGPNAQSTEPAEAEGTETKP